MEKVNRDLLAQAMAEFEIGDVADVPFDLDHPDLVGVAKGSGPSFLDQATAFSRAAAEDTPSDDKEDFVLAGLLQGLWIGYRYHELERTGG